MIQSNANKTNDHETQVRKTLTDIQSNKYKSIKNTACVYSLSNNTFCYHMTGHNSCTNTQQSQQILSEMKKNTFVQWITHLTCVGFPASPSLVMQMAEKIYHKHIHFWNDANASNQFAWPINHNWFYWFESKHFEFVGIWIKLFA